jgi:hypothetical protein
MWRAPPECPQGDYIEEQLKRWLGDAYRLQDSEISADAAVGWVDAGWAVDLRLTRGAHESRRQVTVSTCTEAADFVAVSIALIEDPELGPAPEGAFEPGPSDRDAQGTESEERGSEPLEEAPARPEESRLDPAGTAPSARAANEGEILWSLDAGVGVNFGIFPSPAALASLRLGLRPGPWRLSAGFVWIPRVRDQSPEAQNPAIYSALTGEIQACRTVAVGVFSTGPCLGMELGALSAKEEGGEGTRLPWLAAHLLVAAELALSSLGGFVELGAQIPITQAEFVLAGNTPVHESQVGFLGRMGISILF